MNRPPAYEGVVMRQTELHLTDTDRSAIDDKKPLRHDEPVVCIDEKSLQLIGHIREPLPMTAGNTAKQDYE